MSSKFQLREVFFVTRETILSMQEKYTALGFNTDFIDPDLYNGRNSIKFIRVGLVHDDSVSVILGSNGYPVAVTKAYPADHTWGMKDEALLDAVPEDFSGSDKDYLLGGFIEDGIVKSFFEHSAYVDMNRNEEAVETAFDNLRQLTIEALKRKHIADEKESVGPAHDLIQEVAEKQREAFKAVEEDDGVGEDFVRVKSQRRKRPTAVDSFMNRTAAYTMYDFVSVIKNHCKKKEWELIQKFCDYDARTARLLGELQNKFHFCEVLFEDNAKFTEAYKLVETKGAKEKAQTIKEFASADQIGARLPQAYDKRGLFFAVNHTVREGELKPYVNLYDEKRKMYYTSSSSQAVPYAIALSRATERFTQYAIERDPACEALVPKTQSLKQQYTDADYEVMSDVLTTTSKVNKGSMSVIFNTHGGRAFGDMGKEVICKISPLARLIGDGIPAPFKLQAAYQYDEAFADHWDNRIRTAVTNRQKGAGSEYQEWIESAELFHSAINVSKKFGVVMSPPEVDKKTMIDFDNLVNETHESNRMLVEAISVDRSVFLMLYHRVNLLANEMLGITIINDLFFDGYDLELYDSGDLVNVGHCVSVKRARMPVYEAEEVTMLEEWKKKFDKKPNGKNALIDMRLVHGQEFYVGRGDWSVKIERKKGETRAGVYYDYEPIKSVKKGETYYHTIVSNEESVQFKHAIEACKKFSSGEYDLIGIVVPIRSLPHFIKNFKVQFIYPAPFPAVMSAYVIIGKKVSKVDLMNAYSLVFTMYAKMRYMLSVFQNGAKEMAKLIDYQLELESNDLFANMFALWHEKITKRFKAGGDERTGIVIDDSLDKMLIVDKKYKVKVQIKAGKERADANYGLFKLKKRE